jgi:metallo-beta-lactamase family protein
MKIHFFGAAHEVTGSCHMVETSRNKFLLDCGMFQGSNFSEAKNYEPFPFVASEIKGLFVSHAHLDHTGRIPKLVKDGFDGPIYMTKATRELALLIWQDAYHIMKYEHEKFQSPMLFELADIDEAYSHTHGIDYDVWNTLEDAQFKFHDAGHIFGSSFIEVKAEGKTIVFSGDVGNIDAPIIRDTENLPNMDVLLVESTYGDKIHESAEKRDQILLQMLQEGVARGGTIMIPAFSLERTQELLYKLHTMSEHDKTLPDVPIYLDSPLAIDAMEVYRKYKNYYDKEATEEYNIGDDFLNFPQLRVTRSRDESKAINSVRGPKIVIAGSGMMNGGRIVHHAERYVGDPKSTLIIVGYQAQGTLGRRLYEGAVKVNIFGKDIEVMCKVKAIGALSAHADQNKLIAWIRQVNQKPGKVYCVHGEPASATALAHKIRDEFGIEAFVPEYGDSVEV